MEHIIEVKNVSRSFRSGKETIDVLKGIDIIVKRSVLTIFKGRSGSGKTTLLNLMGALDKPDSGCIYFDGDEITCMCESSLNNFRRINTGFVFQSVALVSMMSAYENVEFCLRVADYNPKARKYRAEECLYLVGLGKRMHHRPGELSGGEQQRVAIARAIAHKPKVVFADEPTAELDTHMGLQIMKLFKDLITKEGITIVMSTHDLGMIDIADKVFALEDGEIVDDE